MLRRSAQVAAERGDADDLRTALTMDTSSIKGGPGVTSEVGHDMRALGPTRVMVLTDPHLAASEPVEAALRALRAKSIDACSSTASASSRPTRPSWKRSPGDLITREELRARLWTADTFVDFEHGLDTAVRRLRAALGDSADAPCDIETLQIIEASLSEKRQMQTLRE